jgi:hypothetical protein
MRQTERVLGAERVDAGGAHANADHSSDPMPGS